MIATILLDKLRVITPEEQKYLDGADDIDRSIYMESADSIITSKKMMSTGKLIEIRPHTRFVHFPEHTHDFVEIVYMCSGSTTHIINGNKIELKEGNLLFLCQGARQEIMPAGEGDIAVNFVVRPEFFDSTLDTIGVEDTPLRRFVVDCLRNSQGNNGYLCFDVADILPVQNILEILIWTILFDTHNKRNITRNTVGLLFLQLINHTDRLVADYGDGFVVKVLEYIESNYKSGTLTELANILHFSVSSLSREIKLHTGKTYTELVQDKRLSQACFLLESTNIRIDDIAESTGYENISFFYRIFKERYGVSPRKYRKDLRNK